MNVGVGDVPGADPHRVRGGLQPHIGHPGADLGQRRDLVGEGAAVAGAVAEHHVDLVGFVQPHGDPGGEQVPQVDHVLARVLQRPDHAHADGAALAGEGGDGGFGAFAEVAFGLVGGQERQLIDDHDQERERAARP